MRASKDKPFAIERPTVKRVIANEVKRKTEGQIPPSWIDDLLGIENPPGWWTFMTYTPGRLAPSFLSGVKRLGTGAWDLAKTVEVPERLGYDPATGLPRRTFGIEQMIWEIAQGESARREKAEVRRQALGEAMKEVLRAWKEHGKWSDEFKEVSEKFEEINASTSIPAHVIAEAVLADLTSRWGSVEEIRYNLITDPFLMAEDLAAIGAPMLRATKVPYLVNAAKWLERTDPSGALGLVGEAVTRTNRLKPKLIDHPSTDIKHQLLKSVREQIGEHEVKENIFFGISLFDHVPQAGDRIYTFPDLESVVKEGLFVGRVRQNQPRIWAFRGQRTGVHDAENNLIEVVVTDSIASSDTIRMGDLPKVDLASGKVLSREQIEAWDADPHVYFRITNEERLGSLHSRALGEGPKVHRRILHRMFPVEFEEYLENHGLLETFERLPDEMREMFVLAHWDDFYEEYQGLGVLPAREFRDFVDVDGNFISRDAAVKQYGQDLNEPEIEALERGWEIWNEYKDIAEAQYGMIPAPIYEGSNPRFERARMQYKGVNAIEDWEGIAQYMEDTDWNEFVEGEGGRGVVQVLRGKYIGETFDRDGRIIIPEETLAVIDLNLLAR